MWTDRPPPSPSRLAGPWRVPTQCEVCRLWSRDRICPDCLDRFAPQKWRCHRCGLRLAEGLEHCGDCLRDPPPYVQTCCAVDYDFPWDRLIAGFKFHDRPELAGPLSRLMLQAAGSASSKASQADLLVPVPLSRARLAERGYNQAWELARRLARAVSRRAIDGALLRVLDTPHQAELGRAQRMVNLRAAFVVPAAARPELDGRHVVLVDDVVTTGATAREAAATLMRAGARRVDLWVLARTPSD